jgi:hypothetical protein
MTVRPPGGPGEADDRWVLEVWERGRSSGPIDRAVILLAALSGCSEQDAERVDLGTRDTLLAAGLFRLAGTAVWSWVRCAGCGSVLDVPLDPAVLPHEEDATADRQPLAVATVDGPLTVRLPDTRDLRAAATAGDASSARRLLLRRLLPGLPAERDIGEDTVAIVETALEKASPGAAVMVTVGCPDCGGATEAAVDVPLLLWCHVEAAAVVLLSEIHVLASAYGWTEPDVLALPPRRRRSYLAMVGR